MLDVLEFFAMLGGFLYLLSVFLLFVILTAIYIHEKRVENNGARGLYLVEDDDEIW
jgi:cbb3-type cytochrome oxidase subunit 3